MEGGGPSSRHKKPCSFTPSCGLLETIEQHILIKKLSSLVPRLGDIWIRIKIEIETYCIQFYKLELDHKVQVGDRIIRIMFSSKDTHILCWRLSKCLNGKSRWGFIGRNDICFNVKIGDNRVKVVRSKKGGRGT
jgi:hypothetical protein